MALKKIIKTSIIALVALILLALACVVGLGMQFSKYASTPTDPNGQEMVFEVARGQGLAVTARDLESAGLVTKPVWFVCLARFQKTDSKIRAGEYVLSASMAPLDILDTMVKGKAILYRLTVPEGITMDQIAGLAEEAGFGTKEAFLSYAKDPDFAASLQVDQKNLEGYLFPETYYFNKNESPDKVITAMVNRFHKVFQEEWRDRAKDMDMTIHEVMTLASIIEKETSAPHERDVVSSVYHNRLKKGIRLQSDPTVIYGIPNFDGNITRKHLKTPTPYNTYTEKGLPPGPIASPGQASIHAALYPAETKYLYFVSKKDGTHQFSTNLKDHNRAVRKYQLRRR